MNIKNTLESGQVALPDPVGPTTKLTRPLRNKSSPSIFNRNWRREGVSDPSDSFDHENVALQKPIRSSVAGSAVEMVALSSSKESNNSVCGHLRIGTGSHIRTHLLQKLIHAIQRDLARYCGIQPIGDLTWL
jgi:hypothetical protein